MSVLVLINPANQDVVDGRRPYRSSSSALGLLTVLFLLLFPVCGVFFLTTIGGAMVTNVVEHWQLQQSGRPVNVTIISKRVVEDDESADTYKVVYRYVLVNRSGETLNFRREEDVAADVYRRLQPEAQAAARYVPSNPQVARLETTLAGGLLGPLAGLGFMGLWSVLFCGVPLLIIIGMIRAFQKEQRLQRGGHVVRGETLSCSSYEDSDNDLNIDLRYRFYTPQGRQIEGRERGIFNVLKGKPLPQPGDTLAIWYVDEKTYTLL